MDPARPFPENDPLTEVRERLDPRTNRERALGALDEMFRAGKAPDPAPQGFLAGRLVATATVAPFDSFAGRLARYYMPWLGKSFDQAASRGINVLKPSARVPMKALWPSYSPDDVGDSLEAFPFHTRVEPGAVDPEVSVLVIDYDFDANPDLVIRHIRDELVQVSEGLYLGKILYRRRSGYRNLGFFSLSA